MGDHRTHLEIIADMLSVINGRAKKTHIMYQANLSYLLLQKYLTKIKEAYLCRFEQGDNCYVLTPRGEEFLGEYRKYVKMNNNVEKWIQDADDHKKALEEFLSTQ